MEEINKDDVIITQPDNNININEKRFYLSGCVIKVKCPACKNFGENNYSDCYFSYPKFNAPFEEAVYCSNCDKEIIIKIQINVNINVEHVE